MSQSAVHPLDKVLAPKLKRKGLMGKEGSGVQEGEIWTVSRGSWGEGPDREKPGAPWGKLCAQSSLSSGPERALSSGHTARFTSSNYRKKKKLVSSVHNSTPVCPPVQNKAPSTRSLAQTLCIHEDREHKYGPWLTHTHRL